MAHNMNRMQLFLQVAKTKIRPDQNETFAGLFHNAIQQSGNEIAYRAIHHEGEKPEEYIRQLAEQMDCPTDESQVMVDCLREIGAWRLVGIEPNCTASSRVHFLLLNKLSVSLLNCTVRS